MIKDQISPVALILTFLFHCGLFILSITNFAHHHPHRSPYDVIRVSIPVNAEQHTNRYGTPDLSALIVAPETLVAPAEFDIPIEKDRYYLPQELSQQVKVIQDETARLNIPIRQIVTMTVYINEAGAVDDITIDEAGDLSDDEQQQLINNFKKLQFLPGMRGSRIVKSIYRIQLQINRKIVIQR